jgi:hypothetical protein
MFDLSTAPNNARIAMLVNNVGFIANSPVVLSDWMPRSVTSRAGPCGNPYHLPGTVTNTIARAFSRE